MSARVLVAADAPMMVAILAHKLRREGHEVTTARDADQLRHALETLTFDIGVIDVAMKASLPGAPPLRSWLALVDGRDDTAARRAMELGAAGLVRTPFKPTDVAAQVETLARITVAST